jgi:hypothetical protein
MPKWKPIIGLGFSADVFANYVQGVVLNAEFRPSFVVLHNTQVPSLADWHDYPGERRMAGLANYYRTEMQWSAGPHLFVADDLIWAFTPLNTPGVHSPSWNHISWGVEMVGDYDSEPLGDDVKRNTLEALAALHRLAGWREPRIKLHREDPRTTHVCPGINVDKAEMEQGVQTLLDLDK